MEGWVIIANFTYGSELAIVKSLLEADEIEYFVKDELTVQAHNFMSNAVGGIKLLVKPEDVERAKLIVSNAGFHPTEAEAPSKFWTKFDAFTSGVPIIGKAKVETKFFIISAVTMLTIAMVIYLSTLPITKKDFIEQQWCLSYITFNGEDYKPDDPVPIINLPGYCLPELDFQYGARLSLPGFSTPDFFGYWHYKDGVLTMEGLDELQEVFESDYTIEMSESSLILTSETTIIYCVIK